MQFQFFYDFVCPFAYLATVQVEALAARTGATMQWRPFLLGGVLAKVGGGAVPTPARTIHSLRDQARWAEVLEVPLRVPAAHPRRTVLALRAALAAGADLPRASRALFRAYWAQGLDVEDPSVVALALSQEGLDGAALVDRAPTMKDELRRRTDEAVAAGVFGAPAFVVRGRLFWGQDRMHFVEKALRGWDPPAPDEEIA